MAGAGRETDVEVWQAIELYRAGWFPMGRSREGPVEWVQPHRRCVLPLVPADTTAERPGRLRIKRSLRQRLRQAPFDIRCDTAFEQVITACQQIPRGDEAEDESWIAPEIVGLFLDFHAAGLAHSVEAWTREPKPRLVGGLYGLALGGVFCGESMFSRVDEGGSGASQICLIHLVGHLRRCGFALLDSQISNAHIEQFGTCEWPAAEYLTMVERVSADATPWLGWAALTALGHVPELGAQRTMST